MFVMVGLSARRIAQNRKSSSGHCRSLAQHTMTRSFSVLCYSPLAESMYVYTDSIRTKARICSLPQDPLCCEAPAFERATLTISVFCDKFIIDQTSK